MSGIATAVIGGAAIGLVGSKITSDAAKDASADQVKMGESSNALSKYVHDTNRADLKPFRNIELKGAEIGLQNLQRYNNIMSGGFKESDAYNFNLDQGINALDRSAVAGGVSRNADTMRFASGLASNEYNNYLNRMSSLGSVGTGYANALASQGTNYANQVGANNQQIGNAMAQGSLASGQAWSQGVNTAGNAPMNALAMYNMFNRN